MSHATLRPVLFLAVIFALLIITGQPLLGTQQPTDPYEPNNKLSQATEIQLPFVAENLTIAPRQDEDFFRFELTATAFVSVDIDADSIGSRLDSTLFVLDETGEEVAFSDDEDGADPKVRVRLKAGRYYIRLTGFFGISMGEYRISVIAQNFGECLESELAVGGSESWSLGELEPGTTINLLMIGPDDTDYDLALIEVVSANPSIDVVVASSAGLSSEESLTFKTHGTKPHEYIARVDAFEGSGSYTLCQEIVKK